VHSTVTDRGGTEGDVKIYGCAVDIVDPDERERYGVALHARIGWRPDGDFHLFAVDITEVGFFRVASSEHEVRHWRAPSGQVVPTGSGGARPGQVVPTATTGDDGGFPPAEPLNEALP